MGTLHAWESFGDGIAVRIQHSWWSFLGCTHDVVQPDIQAVAKGLGGG